MTLQNTDHICGNCGKPKSSPYCKKCKYSGEGMMVKGFAGDRLFALNVCCTRSGLDTVKNLAGRLIGYSCRVCERFIRKEDVDRIQCDFQGQ